MAAWFRSRWKAAHSLIITRRFKSALVWVIADGPHAMRDEARKVIAWQAIEDEAADLRLDETQKRQLSEDLQKARHDLKESVWRSFKHVLLLGKDNTLRQVDWAWCILAQRALR